MHTAKHRIKYQGGLFSALIFFACLIPAVLLALNYYQSYPLSTYCCGIVFVPLAIVAYSAAKECQGLIRTDPAWLIQTRRSFWSRAVVAMFLAACLLHGFYKKFITRQFFGGGVRSSGRLAALVARLALHETEKIGIVAITLAILFCACACGMFFILSAAYHWQERPEKRVYRKEVGRQLLQIAPVLFCFFFTVCFFGSLDIVVSNAAYLQLRAKHIWLALLLISIMLTLLTSIPIACLKPKMFRLIFCFLVGLSLAAYLQGTYFNTNLGTLDGTPVKWHLYGTEALIGAALWALVIGIQPFIYRIFQKKYVKATLFLSLAIIVMQCMALLSVILSAERDGEQYALDGSEQFTVSANDNVVVFTLDYFDCDLMNSVLEKYPKTWDALKDFVYFDNTTALYSLTFPSLCYLYTGEKLDTHIPTREYADRAWHGEKASMFYEILRKRGYQRNLFVNENYAAIDAKNMIGKADNIRRADKLDLTADMLASVIRLSWFRYGPLCVKGNYWTTTDSVNYLTENARKGVTPLMLESTFFPALNAGGLTVSDRGNRYNWYHLQGAHAAYLVDDDGYHHKGERTDKLRQVQGYLVAVEAYLREMQTAGVYDDATIIISADHGCGDCRQITLLVKRPHQKQETLRISHAPASQEDMFATIMDCIGEDYSAFGVSVFDLEEDSKRERTVYFYAHMEEYPEVKWIGDIAQWNMAGDGALRNNVLKVFHYTGDNKTLMKRVQEDTYDEVIPLYDSFY